MDKDSKVGLGVRETREVAEYMQKAIKSRSRTDLPSTGWSLQFQQEVNNIVRIIKEALGNRKKTNWSVLEYVGKLRNCGTRCTGMNEAIESRLRELFPPMCSPSEDIYLPTVFEDCNGYILLWYLPGILSKERQLLIWNAQELMEKRLKVKVGSSSWRDNETYFYSERGFRYKPGAVNFALAWFQQAMETELDMEVSKEMRNGAAQSWVKEMSGTSALLGGLTAVINPAVFRAGIQCIESIQRDPGRIAKNEGLLEILTYWSSPYTVFSLISNRNTPCHRDNGAGYACMDLLLSVGNYTNAYFNLPGLGFNLFYNSGTMVGICGRVVDHGATGEGERLVWAQYLKENILRELDVEEPDWVQIADLVN